MEKLIITVTADAENHVIVDITGAMDAAVIRERMLSKVSWRKSIHRVKVTFHYIHPLTTPPLSPAAHP